MKKQQPPAATPVNPCRRVVNSRRNARRIVFSLSVLALLSALLVTAWPTRLASAESSTISTTGSTSAPTLSPMPSPSGCVAPPSGMTAWLPGGGAPEDISGNNNHGIPIGATFAPGKVAQAVEQNGSFRFFANVEAVTGAQASGEGVKSSGHSRRKKVGAGQFAHPAR